MDAKPGQYWYERAISFLAAPDGDGGKDHRHLCPPVPGYLFQAIHHNHIHSNRAREVMGGCA